MSSLGTSFSIQGANPLGIKKQDNITNTSTAQTYQPNGFGQSKIPQTTPQSKALANMTSSTPSSAIKSRKISTPDGHQIEETYHPSGENGMKPISSSGMIPNNTVTPLAVSTAPTGQSAGVLPPSNTTPSNTPPTYAGLVGNLASKSSQPIPEYTDAITRAREAYKEAADTNQIIQREESNALHNPNYSLDTGIGRAGLIQQNYGQQGQNALTRAAGEAALASTANTQQGLQQSGLGTAAGYAAPILGQYGQANYGIGGNTSGGVQPSDPFYKTLQNYASMAANGQYDAIPSDIKSNPVLNDQLNQLAKGINPNYNPIISSAQGGIQTQQTQQVESYKSALQQGQNLQAQLSDLITSFNLNPNDVNAVNVGLQKIAQNVSSPEYKILNNYVNDIANTYAQILTPSGGSQTDTTRSIATSMLDATASGKSILAVMNSLDEAAKAKISGVPTVGNNTQNTPKTSSSTGGNVIKTKYGDINTDL